ncbi:hypothetical protein ATERTT37_003504 [Aspergillus terreus]
MTAYGGRDLYTSKDSQAKDIRLMRAGIILFIALFAGVVLLSVVTMLKVRVKFYRTERAAVVCALLCVPFMSVRLAFSAGSLFSGEQSVLNPMAGDETITLSATAVALTARKVVVLTAGRADSLKDEEI